MPDPRRIAEGAPELSPAPADSPAARLRPLSYAAPFRWLAAGWRDFIRCPGIGLFYGTCFVLMGWALVGAFEHAPPYTLALCGGFLLVGPFMCMGMYKASQRLEAGETPQLAESLLAWESKMGQLGIFGFVLLVLEMLWARTTLVIFAVTFDGMPDFKGSLLALLDPENISFIVSWGACGALFATLIFSVSVISIPMILHRQTDAITSGLTSIRLVLTQTGVMFWWALIISTLVFLAMLPGFLGLLVVGPLLGHASWHAYREAVVD